MIDWILYLQIILLLLIVYVLASSFATHVIDKRREDAIKRKDANV